MIEHVCKFKLKQDNIFNCIVCDSLHTCGIDECDFLFYNKDQTHVCGLTGLCFNQRVCETYVDAHKSIRGDDPVYIKILKRDQQIKNRSLDYVYTMQLINSIDNIVILTDIQKASLSSKIIMLWQVFVTCTKEKQKYTHRKDKRCFVIAIAMSLNTGICSNTGQYIVKKHDTVCVNKLNKKSKYDTFKVADIRGGTNLIVNVFKNIKLDSRNTIDIH